MKKVREIMASAKSTVSAVVNSRPVKMAVAGGTAAFVAGKAMAQTAPDATTIVTTANTAITSVETAVVGAVGFFIIVKIVKWIRK